MGVHDRIPRRYRRSGTAKKSSAQEGFNNDKIHPSGSEMLRLQRLAGNKAVSTLAEDPARRKLPGALAPPKNFISLVAQRSDDGPAPVQRNWMMTGTGVHFVNLATEGTGRLGRQLGPVGVLTTLANGVELQFRLDPGVRVTYRNLLPRQWAGPESIWVKQGPLTSASWIQHRLNRGEGRDNPEPENQLVRDDLIAYYDSPGPDVFLLSRRRPGLTRIFAAQNFTGWVEGTPSSGGPGLRLCEVAAWHSVVSLVNLSEPGQPPNWQRFVGNTAGPGWVDINARPEI